jgi:hypothetical protein
VRSHADSRNRRPFSVPVRFVTDSHHPATSNCNNTSIPWDERATAKRERQPVRKIGLEKLVRTSWEEFMEVRGLGEGGRSIFREYDSERPGGQQEEGAFKEREAAGP